MNKEPKSPLSFGEGKGVRLLVLSIFCVALRIALLSQKNIWYDEAFSWHLSNLFFYEIFVRTAGDIHPPLYYFILKIWITIFGDTLISMRVLSGIFSTAALYFIFKIACMVLERRDAYLASFLFVISPLNLYFSQEVRMSALNLLLTAASTYYFLRLLKLSDVDR